MPHKRLSLEKPYYPLTSGNDKLAFFLPIIAMCLILFAVTPNAHHRLVVAANRDEQHSRATAGADFWQDQPDILAGRDLVAGGTWLGVSRTGRFAAVTNFAEVPPEPLPPRSRGELTANFLDSDIACLPYLQAVQEQANQYRGFNLIISDGASVYYYGNREGEIRKLGKGYYGLSNQLLDCHWPKVTSGRHELKQQLASNQYKGGDESLTRNLFELLACRGDETPHSARFILGDTYGTSVSTVVEITENKIDFEERGFEPSGKQIRQAPFSISIAH
jgi:uncharacterized protein with NRDE domain